ncbi:MAG: hypothetical protein ABI629_18990 [bacterium]
MNVAINQQAPKKRWEQQDSEPEQLTVLRLMLSGGEILPAQLPSVSHWTPELSLGAAIMAQAMTEIRSRRHDRRDHIQVAAALRWVRTDDRGWPFSFLRICELLQLEPAWVRRKVKLWMGRPLAIGRAVRQAA